MWHHIVVTEEVEVLVAVACGERVRGLVGQRGQGEEPASHSSTAGSYDPHATYRVERGRS